MRRFFLLAVSILFYFFLSVNFVYASFGVSPADLTYEYLSPGMTVERGYLLSRTNTDNVAEIVVEKNVTGVDNWITIEPGDTFTIPKGENTRKMKVVISVPEDAEYKNYKGNLILKIAEGGPAVGVSVVEGLSVDVNLKMSKSEFAKLLVRKMDIPAFIESEPISLNLTIENQGNVIAAPEKVNILVFDLFGKELERDEYASFKGIEPGKTEVQTAEFNTRLKRGDYRGSVTVTFQGKIIKDDQLVFTVNQKKEKLPEEFRVVASKAGDWNFLFKLVILSVIPVSFIWVILRKKYECME